MQSLPSLIESIVKSGFSGDIKVILAILLFFILGVLAIFSRSPAIKDRSFELILLSILCPTIMIIAVQKNARHEIYAGLLGTLIGYFFNASKTRIEAKSNEKGK
ncbi:hypothetical protein [Skermanella stibiiresistens]|uniref:hypothetical protein n=1 Tax=Skermanella stibiiresistens TaxID=913326 RepID=UPI0012FBA387|nr:hypothetical protein [Skermanella stibiiresistens]